MKKRTVNKIITQYLIHSLDKCKDIVFDDIGKYIKLYNEMLKENFGLKGEYKFKCDKCNLELYLSSIEILESYENVHNEIGCPLFYDGNNKLYEDRYIIYEELQKLLKLYIENNKDKREYVINVLKRENIKWVDLDKL